MPFCTQCDYYSDRGDRFDKHVRKHAAGIAPRKSEYRTQSPNLQTQCLLCSQVLPNRHLVQQHLTSAHDVVISKTDLTFDDEAAFQKWKVQVEKDTASRFVRHRGIEKSTHRQRTIYYCHRDGVYKPHGSGKRQLKRLGSNKINSGCPARMAAVTDMTNGSVQVEFIGSHVGHSLDLGRLNLSKNERREIASKIAAGVSFKDILKGVRENVLDNANVNHLLTSKDLWNIQQEFNLNNEACRPHNIQSWITDNHVNRVVRFHKQIGFCLSMHPELSSDDFVLVIANDWQLAVLEEFGNDCLCINEIQGLNTFDLVLTVMAVLDKSRRGLPCAFMLSNRTDVDVMNIFSTVVKNQLSTPIAPRVLVSGVAEAYRKVWCDVRPSPRRLMYWAWDVDQAWKASLGKIKDDAKKGEVYKTLRRLLEETDEVTFERLLHSAVVSFEVDPDKQDFGDFFKTEFARCTHQWAMCYRSHLELDANENLERLHKTIERCYFQGVELERLDQCLNVLMRQCRDELFNRPTACGQGVLTKKLSNMRQCHLAALSMENWQLSPNKQGWTISCSSETAYAIVPWMIDCNCNVGCEECDICIHSYKCECLDSSVNWDICQHIHFVCCRDSPADLLDQQVVLCSDGDVGRANDDSECVEPVIILEELSRKPDPSVSFESAKAKLMELCRSTLEHAQNIDDLILFQNAVLPLIPKMGAAPPSCV